jgi:hypothetical protein
MVEGRAGRSIHSHLATSFLDILGDPNVSPFRPLQYASQEWQGPSSRQKSIWAQDIAGVRVTLPGAGKSVMAWLSPQSVWPDEDSTKQTATSCQQSSKLSYTAEFLHNLYATYDTSVRPRGYMPMNPPRSPPVRSCRSSSSSNLAGAL